MNLLSRLHSGLARLLAHFRPENEKSSISNERVSPASEKRLCVVKLGSAAVTDEFGYLDDAFLSNICKQITTAHADGWNFVLVSSGAMVSGRSVVKRQGDHGHIHDERRVFSAVGQSRLISKYDSIFANISNAIVPAQILLTRQSLVDRDRYNVIRDVIDDMVANNILPIINSNDATNSRSLDFYDNDQIAAYVAAMVAADMILFVTDIDGVFDKNPKDNPDARIVSVLPDNPDEWLRSIKINDSKSSFGGMRNKLQALKLMSGLGIASRIGSKRERNILLRTLRDSADDQFGTKLSARSVRKVDPRRRWVIAGAYSKGILVVSSPGAEALWNPDTAISLLAVGIIRFFGSFEKLDVVTIRNADFELVGMGQSRYSARELEKLVAQYESDASVQKQSDDTPIVVHVNDLFAAKDIAFVDQNDRQLVMAAAVRLRGIGYIIKENKEGEEPDNKGGLIYIANRNNKGRQKAYREIEYHDAEARLVWLEALKAREKIGTSPADWILFRALL